jgi:hypothetical protein
MSRTLWLLALGLAAVAAPAQAAPVKMADLKNAVTGEAKVQSIDVIRFGPKGLLLIGDGKGSQVVAVDTGDTTMKTWSSPAIERIDEKLAGRLGVQAKALEIIHLAVNPASGTAYFSVRRQGEPRPVILTVDGTGKVSEFALDSVKHLCIALPRGEKAPASKVTDLAWAGDRLLVAAQANEEFGSKVYSIPTPLDAKAKPTVFSTETYHVSHKKWETKAPLSTVVPYEEDGKKYVVGSFACTPIVKYPLEDLKPDSHVKGTSVVELGSGNRPLNMFIYEKGGKSYALINGKRMFQPNAYGPSPYWTMRLDLGILSEKEKVNQQALLRLNAKGQPATDRIQVVDGYFGVTHLDRLDKNRALVVRKEDNGSLTLTPMELP